MGEDRGGTNVIEGQTGLPVSFSIPKCCMIIHGYMYMRCLCVFSPCDEEIISCKGFGLN